MHAVAMLGWVVQQVGEKATQENEQKQMSCGKKGACRLIRFEIYV